MPTVKIIAVLAVMVLLTKKRLPLGHILFISAGLLGLVLGMSPQNLIGQVYSSFISKANYTILLALFLINIMEA